MRVVGRPAAAASATVVRAAVADAVLKQSSWWSGACGSARRAHANQGAGVGRGSARTRIKAPECVEAARARVSRRRRR